MPVNPQKYRANRGLRRQRGVGLIEVMIAVLVLAIGLLGLAAMQVRTLRDNESASERGIAVVQTHSIVDAMRADRTNATNGTFNILATAGIPAGSTFRDVAIAAWRNNLLATLGTGATGAIACNGTLCTVTVQWNDSRGSGGTATFSVQTVVQL